jgi:hypothetical protein
MAVQFAVGTRVWEDGREGTVVRIPASKGMVDVQFDDAAQVMRRSASNLTDTDPHKDHMRRWRQRVYEALVMKELGKKEFYTKKGRIDVIALESGRLTREDIDQMVSRAFASTTKQAKKPLTLKGSKVTGGWLIPGTQTPTGRTRAASAKDREDAAHHAERLAQYELTLQLRRKKKNPSEIHFAALAMRDINRTAGNVKTGVGLLAQGRVKDAARHSLDASYDELERKLQQATRIAGIRSNPDGFSEGVAHGKEIKRRRFAKKRSTHLKGVARAGESLEIMTARSKFTEMTDTILYGIPADHDPDAKGYFVLVYDPRRRRKIERALEKIGGWKSAPEITASGVLRGTSVDIKRGQVVRSAPEVHEVVQHKRGHHSVVGPKAKPSDVYASIRDAKARAKQLDIEAHRLITPNAHAVRQIESGAFIAVGPEADEYEYPSYSPVELKALRAQAERDAKKEGSSYQDYQAEQMKKRRIASSEEGPSSAEKFAEWKEFYSRGRSRAGGFVPRETSSPRGERAPVRTAWDALRETFLRGPFATREEAERAAAKLDRMSVRKGVLPLEAKRTKPGYSTDKAVSISEATYAALLDEGVFLSGAPLATEVRKVVDSARTARATEKSQAQPTIFHKLSIKRVREVLKESGQYNDKQIETIIEAEKYNRAQIEFQLQRQAQLEAGRIGKRPGEYIERKEVK